MACNVMQENQPMCVHSGVTFRCYIQCYERNRKSCINNANNTHLNNFSHDWSEHTVPISSINISIKANHIWSMIGVYLKLCTGWCWRLHDGSSTLYITIYIYVFQALTISNGHRPIS